METNNTPNVSDLARWIDLQLSTIIEGASAGYTLGNYNSVWIDKGSTVFNVSLANGETVEIDSDNYNTAEEIANAIISTINNTSTMNANETTESIELSHAGQCLDIYLHNDSFIYESYTQKAIEAIANDGLLISSEAVRRYVRNAIDHASWQVEKYDHLTPTAQDIEQVTRNYVAYIVDCAK